MLACVETRSSFQMPIFRYYTALELARGIKVQVMVTGYKRQDMHEANF